ncbi:MAG: glycerol-3-phosphate 1-O-acyltransferase PlsY [Candidatus Omnitrophota bacterium]
MLLLKIILSCALSYLVGSIPTAYVFGRLIKRIDIREHGSGNVGATNAIRVLGKGPGTLVLLLDILKGIVATSVVADCFGLERTWMLILLGLIAVAGHNWTVFLEFKGGKGMATSLGVLIGLMIKIAPLRIVVLFSVLVWLVVFLVSGFVSLASILAAVFLPIFMVLSSQSIELIALGVVLCVFIVLRHRPNIKRLLSQQEPRVHFPFRKPPH